MNQITSIFSPNNHKDYVKPPLERLIDSYERKHARHHHHPHDDDDDDDSSAVSSITCSFDGLQCIKAAKKEQKEGDKLLHNNTFVWPEVIQTQLRSIHIGGRDEEQGPPCQYIQFMKMTKKKRPTASSSRTATRKRFLAAHAA